MYIATILIWFIVLSFSDIWGKNSESWQEEQTDTIFNPLSWLEQELGWMGMYSFLTPEWLNYLFGYRQHILIYFIEIISESSLVLIKSNNKLFSILILSMRPKWIFRNIEVVKLAHLGIRGTTTHVDNHEVIFEEINAI